MDTKRTDGHWLFGGLLRRRGPSDVEVRDEVPLSDEPPRVDYLLLRRPAPSQPSEPGQSLRGLWPLLSLVTIVDLKSLGRPYRSGNLDKLWSYLHAYYVGARAELPRRDDLRGVLVVAARSPALDADVDAMRLSWKDLGGGYWRLEGGAFPLYAVDIDVVAEQEHDDVLGLFGHGTTEPSLEARRFWAEQVGAAEAGMEPQDLEGYEDVLRRLVDVFPRKPRPGGGAAGASQ